MPWSTSWANSAPMPVYGKLTPTFTSWARAHAVVMTSTAAIAMIRFPIGVPPLEVRARSVDKEPMTANTKTEAGHGASHEHSSHQRWAPEAAGSSGSRPQSFVQGLHGEARIHQSEISGRYPLSVAKRRVQPQPRLRAAGSGRGRSHFMMVIDHFLPPIGTVAPPSFLEGQAVECDCRHVALTDASVSERPRWR